MPISWAKNPVAVAALPLDLPRPSSRRSWSRRGACSETLAQALGDGLAADSGATEQRAAILG